jgi:hypothetical protein
MRVADSVWSAWRRASRTDDEPAIALVVRSAVDPDIVVSAVRGRDGSSPYTPVLTPAGVALYIEEPDDFEAVVLALRDRLQSDGVGGSLEPLAAVAKPLPKLADVFMCRMRLSGEPTMPPRGAARWVPNQDAAHAAVRQMVEWCGDPASAGQWYADVGPVSFPLGPNEPASLAAFVESALRHRSGIGGGFVTVVSRTAGRFRTASLDAQRGAFTLIEGGVALSGDGWRSSLQAISSALVAAREHIVYGYIRRAARPTFVVHAEWSLSTDWPTIPQFDAVRAHDYLVDWRLVPDAFGVQLLTPAHQPRPAAAAWQTEPIGSGADLVSHADVAAWFAEAQPTGDVLSVARADFGPLLITQHDIDRAEEDLRTAARNERSS